MSNSSNSQNSNQMPWWHREKRDGLGERIRSIQKVNDPTTYTDEVLRASRLLLTLLLCFSGVLGALSYFQNFSISFPFEIAIFLAAVLTVVIEWGKNRAATWAIRIPFFQGFQSVWATPANTFIFSGLILVAAATFYMSVYNSTKGGEQLARILSHEKNKTSFLPDTRTIDDQIATVQQSVTNAPMVKWKGKMYYQDAKSVRASQKTIENLSRQRETIIAAQLADHQKNTSIQEGQTNFAANLVLASGGWIEFLQVLLILLRVACEKNLDGRSSPIVQHSRPEPSAYQPQTAFSTASAQKIGFNIDESGNVRRADHNHTVTQLPFSVTQHNESDPPLTTAEVLRWFETELRREPSNLANRHANKDTVINRIYNKLNKAENYLAKIEDNSLPTEAATRFEQYLTQDLFTKVEYPNASNIISLIQQKRES